MTSPRGGITSPRRGTAALLVLFWCVALLAGCTSGTSGTPSSSAGDGAAIDAAVAQFAAAWQAAQPDPIAALTTDPAAASEQVTSTIKNLAPTSIAVSTGAVTMAGTDAASTTASFVWTMPRGITWKYDTTWKFARTGSGASANWLVSWAPTVINPQLGAAQSLVLRTTDSAGGTLVDRNNQQLVSPVTVYSVVALPGKITDLPTTAAALEKLLKPLDPTVTAASVVAGVKKADPSIGYTVTNLRETEYQKIKPQLDAIGGLAFPSQVRSLPPTKDFAKILLSEVESVATGLVAGTPGWKIVTVDASGAELDTLISQDAKPGANVMLTIDQTVQESAEKALAGTPEPAMLVAIQPSTGEILAVAQNAAANAQGPLALMGEYPPGSTFKIVTATAAFDSGQVTPTTPIDCPGQVVIDSRAIHNEGFELGTVPLTTAFAKSCNTTFAKLATQLPGDALTKAAGQYGIGRDFVIPGITTLTGKVPVADSTVQKAENGFGQGVVLVTPFSAALMAATAATGNMPMPSLIRGRTTTIDTPATPRSAAVQSGIRTLMRAVVTDGTALILQDAGDVYAKTGTADFIDAAGKDKAHAWTVGFRGDVAFSVLIVGGDTSKRTNVIADNFLHGIPQ